MKDLSKQYNALRNIGITEKEIGSVSKFTEAMKDSVKVKALYNHLSKDKRFIESNLGMPKDYKELFNAFNPDAKIPDAKIPDVEIPDTMLDKSVREAKDGVSSNLSLPQQKPLPQPSQAPQAKAQAPQAPSSNLSPEDQKVKDMQDSVKRDFNTIPYDTPEERAKAQAQGVDQTPEGAVSQDQTPEEGKDPSKELGFWSRAGEAFLGGVSSLGAGLGDLAKHTITPYGYKTDPMYNGSGFRSKAETLELLDYLDRVEKKGYTNTKEYKDLSAVNKSMRVYAEKQHKIANEVYGYNEDGTEKQTTDLILEGEIGKGIGKAFISFGESAPSSLTALLPGGLYIIGASAAENAYAQSEGSDMSEGQRIFNAIGQGGIEVYTEKMKMGKVIDTGKIFKYLSKEVASHMTLSILKRLASGIAKGVWDNGIEEWKEETIGGIAGIGLDWATNGFDKEFKKLPFWDKVKVKFEEVVNSGIYGFAGGVGFGGAVSTGAITVGEVQNVANRAGKDVVKSELNSFNETLKPTLAKQFNNWMDKATRRDLKTSDGEVIGSYGLPSEDIKNTCAAYASGLIDESTAKDALTESGLLPSQINDILSNDNLLLGAAYLVSAEEDAKNAEYAKEDKAQGEPSQGEPSQGNDINDDISDNTSDNLANNNEEITDENGAENNNEEINKPGGSNDFRTEYSRKQVKILNKLSAFYGVRNIVHALNSVSRKTGNTNERVAKLLTIDNSKLDEADIKVKDEFYKAVNGLQTYEMTSNNVIRKMGELGLPTFNYSLGLANTLDAIEGSTWTDKEGNDVTEKAHAIAKEGRKELQKMQGYKLTPLDEVVTQARNGINELANLSNGNVTTVKIKGREGQYKVRQGNIETVKDDKGNIAISKKTNSDEIVVLLDEDGRPLQTKAGQIESVLDDTPAFKQAKIDGQLAEREYNNKRNYPKGSLVSIKGTTGFSEVIESDATGVTVNMVDDDGNTVTQKFEQEDLEAINTVPIETNVPYKGENGISAVITDVNDDGTLDIKIVSGGGEVTSLPNSTMQQFATALESIGYVNNNIESRTETQQKNRNNETNQKEDENDPTDVSGTNETETNNGETESGSTKSNGEGSKEQSGDQTTGEPTQTNQGQSNGIESGGSGEQENSGGTGRIPSTNSEDQSNSHGTNTRKPLGESDTQEQGTLGTNTTGNTTDGEVQGENGSKTDKGYGQNEVENQARFTVNEVGNKQDAHTVVQSDIKDLQDKRKKLAYKETKFTPKGSHIEKIAQMKAHRAKENALKATADAQIKEIDKQIKFWQDVDKAIDKVGEEKSTDSTPSDVNAPSDTSTPNDGENGLEVKNTDDTPKAVDDIPESVEDTPAKARERGSRIVQGIKYIRQAFLKNVMFSKKKGDKSSDYVPFSMTEKVKSKVAILEGERVLASHENGVENPRMFMGDAQPKDRTKGLAKSRAEQMADDPRIGELASVVTPAYSGAPVINRRGEVIQGNGRTDAIKQMYQNKNGKNYGEAYKQYLIDHAEELGFDPKEVAKMKNPILVRMIDVEDSEGVRYGWMTAEQMESGVNSKFSSRQVIRLAGKKVANLIRILTKNEAEDEKEDKTTIRSLIQQNAKNALLYLLQNNYITKEQYSGAHTESGDISGETIDKLLDVVRNSLFAEADSGFPKRFNNLPYLAQNAILQTAFRDTFTKNKSDKIGEDIRQAIKLYHELSVSDAFKGIKRTLKGEELIRRIKDSMKVRDAFSGTSIGERYTPFQQQLAINFRVLTTKENVALFNKFFDLIQNGDSELFGENSGTRLTKEKAIEEVFKIKTNGQEGSTNVDGDPNTSKQGNTNDEGQNTGPGTIAKGGGETTTETTGEKSIDKIDVIGKDKAISKYITKLKELTKNVTKYKVVLSTKSEFIAHLEASDRDIDKRLLARLKEVQSNERVRGFFYDGKVIILADQVTSESDMINTFYHEHQHTEVTKGQIDDLIEIYKKLTKGNEEDARAQLVLDVQKISGVRAYDNASIRKLADELIAHMASIQMMGGRVTEEINRTVKTYINKISNDTKKGLDDNGGSTRGDKRPSSNEQGGSGQNDSNNEAKPKDVKNGSTRKGSGREVLKARNPKSHVIGESSTIKEVEEDFYEMTKNSPVDVTLTTTEEFISKFSPQNERQYEILKHVALMRRKIRARVAKGTPRSEATTVAGFYVSGEHIYLFADGLDKAEFKDNKANQLKEVFTHEFRHFMNYQEKVEENGRNYNETSELSREIVNSKIEGVTIATIVKLHGRSRDALKKTLHSLCGHGGYDDLKMSKLANEISAFAAGRKISGKEYVLPGYPPLSETLTKFLDKTINETRSKLNGNNKGGIPISDNYRQSSSRSDATNTKGTSRDGRIRSANRSEEEGTTDGIDIFDADEISFSFAGNEGTEEFKSRKELEESKQFKEWNGDNEIVRAKDAMTHQFKNGEKVTVVGYHGTEETFNAFRQDKIGSRNGSHFGSGFYFSNDYSVAQGYTSWSKSRIIDAYVKFEKPIVGYAKMPQSEVRTFYNGILEQDKSKNPEILRWGTIDKLIDYLTSGNKESEIPAYTVIGTLERYGYPVNEINDVLYKTLGYDGYINKVTSEVMFYASTVANHIKTTEPTTINDEGEIIPQDQRFGDSDDIRFSVSDNNKQTTDKTNNNGTEEKTNSENKERDDNDGISNTETRGVANTKNESEPKTKFIRGVKSSLSEGLDDVRFSIKEEREKAKYENVGSISNNERHTMKVARQVSSLNKSRAITPHIIEKEEFVKYINQKLRKSDSNYFRLAKDDKTEMSKVRFLVKNSTNKTKEIRLNGDSFIFSDALKSTKDIQGAYYRSVIKGMYLGRQRKFYDLVGKETLYNIMYSSRSEERIDYTEAYDLLAKHEKYDNTQRLQDLKAEVYALSFERIMKGEELPSGISKRLENTIKNICADAKLNMESYIVEDEENKNVFYPNNSVVNKGIATRISKLNKDNVRTLICNPSEYISLCRHNYEFYWRGDFDDIYKNRGAIGGFFSPKNQDITIFKHEGVSEDSNVATFIHEYIHFKNDHNSETQSKLVNLFKGNENNLTDLVQYLSRSRYYEGTGEDNLCDELMAYTVSKEVTEGNVIDNLNIKINGNEIKKLLFNFKDELAKDIETEEKNNEAGTEDVRFSFAGTEGTETFKSREELENSKEFKEWNGGNEIVSLEDSKTYKVKKGKGFTVVALHGTGGQFNTFDSDKVGTNGREHGTGFYFSNDINTANAYKKEGGRIIEAYVKFEKPILENNHLTKNQLASFFKELRRIELDAVKGDESEDQEYSRLDEFGNFDDLMEALGDNDVLDIVSEMAYMGYPIGFINKALYNSTGYDGLVKEYDSGIRYFIPNIPNHIKTTEVTTITDEGEIIPINERFTENDDIRFSVVANQKSNSTDDRRITGHAVNSSMLPMVAELGGFPVASTFGGKISTNMGTFGDVVMYLPSDFMNPNKRGNAIYDRDAWTKTIPRPEYQTKGKELARINDDVRKSIEEHYGKDVLHALSFEIDIQNKVQTTHSIPLSIDLSRKSAYQLDYLTRKGVKVRVPMETRKFLLIGYGVDLTKSEFSNLKSIKTNNKEFGDIIKSLLKKQLSDSGIKDKNNLEEVYNKLVERYFDDEGLLHFPYYDNLKQSIRRYDVNVKDVDQFKLQDRIKSKMLKRDFKQLQKELETKILDAQGWKHFKDNDKSYSYTLDKIEEYLKGNVVGGFDSWSQGFGKTKGMLAKKLNTQKAVNKSIDNVKSREEVSEYNKKLGKELDELSRSEELVYKYDGSESDYESFLRAITTYDKVKNLSHALIKNDFEGDVSEEFEKEFIRLYQKLKNAPVEYIEAKNQYTVKLNEFKTAIVPKGISKRYIDVLKKANIKTYTYELGNEQSRQEATERATRNRDLRFSIAESKNTEEIQGLPSSVSQENSDIEDNKTVSQPYSKDLVVLHNISGKNLLRVAKYTNGNLVVPSLAVTPYSVPFNSYSDITLLGSKDMIKPEETYPRDVYSPIVPTKRNTVDDKVIGKIRDDVNKNIADNYPQKVTDMIGEGDKFNKALLDITRIAKNGSAEDVATEFSKKPLYQLDYLTRHGKKIDITKIKPSGKYESDVQDAYDLEDEISKTITKKGIEKLKNELVGKIEKGYKGYEFEHNGKTYDFNAENIKNAMKGEVRNKTSETSDLTISRVEAMLSEPFNSVDEIHSKSSSINPGNTQQYNFEISENIDELAESSIDFKLHEYEDNRMEFEDQLLNAFVEYHKSKDIVKALRKGGFETNYDESQIAGSAFEDKFVETYEKLKNAPSNYFESKPQREVGLSEFTSAIVPIGTSDEIKAVLKEKNIRVVEYDKSVKGSRQEAVEKASDDDDVRFSIASEETTNKDDDVKTDKEGYVKAPDLRKINSVSELSEIVRMFNARRISEFGVKGRQLVTKTSKTAYKAVVQQTTNAKEGQKLLTDLARKLTRSGNLSYRAENRILTILKDSTNKKDIVDGAQSLIGMISDKNLQRSVAYLGKMLENPNKKTGSNGVKRSSLGDDAREFIETFSKAMTQNDDELQDLAEENFRTNDNKYFAVRLAQKYREVVQTGQDSLSEMMDREADIIEELKDLRGNARIPLVEELRALRDSMNSTRQNLSEEIDEIATKLSAVRRSGRFELKLFRDAKYEQKRRISHYGASDLKSVETNINPSRENLTLNQRMHNWAMFSHLKTFENMLKSLGRSAVGGRGYLYDHFVPRIQKASDKSYMDKKNDREVLDDKVKEIYGFGHNWLSIMKRSSNRILKDENGETVEIIVKGTNGKEEVRNLTNGQAVYIYAVNKMTDGKVKLANMGITEDVVKRLEELIPEKLKRLADFVQQEFLPQKRKIYNETHKRVFGISMDEIENYVPLRINKSQLVKAEDVDNIDQGDLENVGTSTGAIKRRVFNKRGIDIENTDFMHTISQHLDEMNEWNAYVEIKQDINSLLSDRNFREKMKAIGGEKYWKSFKDVSKIAVKAHNDDIEDSNSFFDYIFRGAAVSKVLFRLNTAFKQTLSLTAMMTEPSVEFTKHMAIGMANPLGTFLWALKNLPSLNKRWASKFSGDEKLLIGKDNKIIKNLDKYAIRYGMTPNALIDAITCSIGAKARYKQVYKESIENGMSEEDAVHKATVEAELFYNLTQQSAESMFLSKMQKSGRIIDQMLTLFNNASFSYGRRLLSSSSDMVKLATKKGEVLAFTEKKIMRQMGLEEVDDNIKSMARKEYNRGFARDAMTLFSIGVVSTLFWEMASNWYYIFTGDDDDKKKGIIYNALQNFGLNHFRAFFTGGGFVESLIRAVQRSEDGKGFYYKFGENLHPANQDISRDIATIRKAYKKDDPIMMIYALSRSLVRFGTGIDLKSLSNMTFALVQICDERNMTFSEAAYDLSFLLNIPPSQIKESTMNRLKGESDRDWVQRLLDYRKNDTYGFFAPLHKNTDEEIKNAEKDIEKYKKKSVDEREKKLQQLTK